MTGGDFKVIREPVTAVVIQQAGEDNFSEAWSVITELCSAK